LIAFSKTISAIEIKEIESALENSKLNIILKPLLKLILIISSSRV